MSHVISQVREHLLSATAQFVRSLDRVRGVRRAMLIGSLTTDKPNPKDVDILLFVDDDADLAPLAVCARRLLGATQSINHGTDVFLADPQGHYLGRTCLWKDCRPGVRMACDALHCGRRKYLHDDFSAVRLSDAVIAAAYVQLWPKVELNGVVPADVEQLLMNLKENGKSKRSAATLSLLVLKTPQMDPMRAFYGELGVELVEEQHGKGPVHYSGRVGEVLLELYPLPADGAVDVTTRLGFAVAQLMETVQALEKAGATVATQPQATPWGERAVVRDPDGRAVELYQR